MTPEQINAVADAIISTGAAASIPDVLQAASINTPENRHAVHVRLYELRKTLPFYVSRSDPSP